MKGAVAAVLALVLLLGGALTAIQLLGDDGSSPSSERPRDPASTAPAEPGSSTAPEPDLDAFYGQRLDWRACGSNDCARLMVPLDYAHPEAKRIELAVLRVPARQHPIGALVVNPGGPGAPGTSYAAAGARVFRAPLLDHYDIVGFDPRGTGDSDPVDCLSDADLDAYLARDPSPDDASETRSYVAEQRAFGAGCARLSGALASHISTIEAARDMDVLRSALGQSRLDFFGASYGTKLGATYAELFPHRVGRFVLDGAVDVSADLETLTLQQAQGFETALRAYVDNCVRTTSSCFLGSSVDEGLAKIKGLLDQVDAHPLPTGTDRELTAGLAYAGIGLPLYDRQYWILLSQALKAAFDGQGGPLLQLSDAYTDRGPDGYHSNLMEAFPAISCLDDPTVVKPGRIPSLLPKFEEAAPTFGDAFAWGLVQCLGFQPHSAEKPVTIDGKGAPPIVVIGTTRDPATPMLWAEHLAAQLDSGVLIRRDGDGHTGYNSGNSCVDTAVEDYLLHGAVPRDGLSC